MAYASRAGRARTSSTRPRAFAVCDRCGIWYNHYQLRWQFDWAGTTLVNKRILICSACIDNPQQQLRAIVLPADPVPILNPRPEQAINAYTELRMTDSMLTDDERHGIPIPQGDIRVTQNLEPRTTQQAQNNPLMSGYGAARFVGSGAPRYTEDGRLRIVEWHRRV